MSCTLEELYKAIEKRYKDIIKESDIQWYPRIIDKRKGIAIVTFYKNTNSFSAIFECNKNGRESYWYCTRDWND